MPTTPTARKSRKTNREVTSHSTNTPAPTPKPTPQLTHTVTQCPSFKYGSLVQKAQQIRILHLIPGKPDTPLSGLLQIASLESKSRPEFDAISYVWGDPRATSHISIDGRNLPIASNLHNALVAIRHESEWRILWVDALCINQQDIQERGHQVQLMRNIFSSARIVRVWLEVDVDPTSPVFDAARRLWVDDDNFTMANIFPENPQYSSMPTNPAGLVHHEQYPPEFWTPLYEIISDAYWGRVWTQQEFFLSKSLIFHFPRGTSDPEPILRFEAATVIGYASVDVKRALPTQKIVEMADSVGGFGGIFRGLFSRRYVGFAAVKLDQNNFDTLAPWDRPNLFDLVLKTPTLDASDPRDRVYGVIGLARDCIKHPLQADYTLSLVQTYIKVIHHFIDTHNNLDFLCCYDAAYSVGPWYDVKPDEDIPSWLPYLKRSSQPLYQWLGEWCRASGTMQHRPAGGKVSSPDDNNNNNNNNTLLHVRGVQCDVITASARSSFIDTPVPALHRDIESIYQTTQPISSSSSSPCMWHDPTFIWTLFFQWVKDMDSGAAYIFEKRLTTLHQLGIDAQDVMSTCESSPALSNLTLTELIKKSPSDLSDFLTEDQLTVARGLWPGDEVWVLFGCPMPMVLRPCVDDQVHV
ncbi:heterokaryon incompatibility protein-domain-containing protein [Podospora aff. communis PSN243]|uniref:Heterokaryon incompatibility protein-domain-containing protein n=1 Tax=Podospora aff. communis PSN243 TaxID=3040156 RepID=A0AAV9G7E7_9PEZI|nr:heterokaryon incompatibility protein-domain-containing protein [Podospora aff. communis PSN243]